MSKRINDEELYMKLWNAIEPIWKVDPYGLCSCGHHENHDSECKLDLMLYDFVIRSYEAMGGKFCIVE